MRMHPLTRGEDCLLLPRDAANKASAEAEVNIDGNGSRKGKSMRVCSNAWRSTGTASYHARMANGNNWQPADRAGGQSGCSNPSQASRVGSGSTNRPVHDQRRTASCAKTKERADNRSQSGKGMYIALTKQSSHLKWIHVTRTRPILSSCIQTRPDET
eukprot:6178306-Pleurochrysis_carterae.AAC.2